MPSLRTRASAHALRRVRVAAVRRSLPPPWRPTTPGQSRLTRGLTVMTRSPRRNTPLQRRPILPDDGASTDKPVQAVSGGEPGSLVGTCRPTPVELPVTVAPPPPPLVLPDPDAGREHLRRRPAALGDGRRLDRPGRRPVALVWANLDFASYEHLRDMHVGPLDVEHWAADGALAIFFFVAGLELKRELLVGSLRRPADAAGPGRRRLLRRRGAGADLRGGQPRHRQPGAAGPCRPPPTSRSPSPILAVVGSALPVAAARLPAHPRGGRRPDRDRGDRGLLHLEHPPDRPARRCRRVPRRTPSSSGCRVRSSLVYLPLAAVIAWAAMYESGVHATIAGVVLGLLTRVLPDDGRGPLPRRAARAPARRRSAPGSRCRSSR